MLAERDDEEAIPGSRGLEWCCVGLFWRCVAENRLGVLMVVVLVNFGIDKVVLLVGGGGGEVEVVCRRVMSRMHAGEGVWRSWAGWRMNSCCSARQADGDAELEC